MIQLRRILVAADLAESSGRVFSHAEALARCFDAEFHIIHVRETGLETSADRQGVVPFEVAGIQIEPELLPGLISATQVGGVIGGASPDEALLAYARAEEIDLIVMGGRGPSGLRMPRLGIVASHIVRHAPCPVLTVRHGYPTRGVRCILVPVDLSDPSRNTLALARRMAAQFQSRIDLLHVIEHPGGPTSFSNVSSGRMAAGVESEWEARLKDFWEETEGPEVVYEPHVRSGPTAPEIINFSLERNSDLLLIGTHGRTGLRRVLMGSVAERVVNNALCATLAVKSFPTSLSTARKSGRERVPVPA